MTVRVPVCNGMATLLRAVESILRQTHPTTRVHNSDNGSIDATGAVGQAPAAEHASVYYTRQLVNLGPCPNFHFLLEQAATPYFRWVAAMHGNYPGTPDRSGAIGGVCWVAASTGAAGVALAANASGSTTNAAAPASKGVFALVGLGWASWGGASGGATRVMLLRCIAVYAGQLTEGQGRPPPAPGAPRILPRWSRQRRHQC